MWGDKERCMIDLGRSGSEIGPGTQMPENWYWDSNVRKLVLGLKCPRLNYPWDSNVQDSNVRDSNVRDSNVQDSNSRDSNVPDSKVRKPKWEP